MKTKEEIKQWLKNKRVYGRVINYNIKHIDARFWHDEFDIEKGVNNFDWCLTKEPLDFWGEMNDEFIRWYHL